MSNILTIQLAQKEIERYSEKLIELVTSLSEDQLWKKPPGMPNAIGTLTMHLVGNLNHYFGAVSPGRNSAFWVCLAKLLSSTSANCSAGKSVIRYHFTLPVATEAQHRRKKWKSFSGVWQTIGSDKCLSIWRTLSVWLCWGNQTSCRSSINSNFRRWTGIEWIPLQENDCKWCITNRPARLTLLCRFYSYHPCGPDGRNSKHPDYCAYLKPQCRIRWDGELQ